MRPVAGRGESVGRPPCRRRRRAPGTTPLPLRATLRTARRAKTAPLRSWPRAGARSSLSVGSGVADGGSTPRRIAWTLVPPNPIDVTPASGMAAATRPRLDGRLDTQLEPIEIDGGVDLVEVKRRHELSVLDAQGRLDQAQHARCRVEMPDVRLDRSDATRPVGRPCRHDDAEGLGFHRVTLGRARSVELYVVHRLRARCPPLRKP